MNKELIEQLKDKNYVRAFGLMTPEEQECFRKVGKKNCRWFTGANWVECADPFTWGRVATYAIKPDYQPEPEFVDLEIVSLACSDIGKQGIQLLGVLSVSFLPYHFTHLHCLPNLPNFEGFKEEHVEGTLAIERIARYIHEGKKVFARFRV